MESFLEGGRTMSNIISVVIGYFLGCLSPAAFLGRKHNIDLREEGTGNLGATNTTMVLGKKAGAFVMIFDIAKAYIAAQIAKWLFPKQYYAGLLASCATVFGHVYPFHMKFKGGKGLASFAGMVLAYDPVIFLILLAVGLVSMVIVNYGVAMPLTGALLFPVVAGVGSMDVAVFTITAAASAVVIIAHWPNIGKAMRHEHLSVREFIKEKLMK
jgi:glycerol-3-phosphate acyltransferase PlsY